MKSTSVSLGDPNRPAAVETRLENWQVFGGVNFPQQITKFHGKQKLAEITVEQIKVNGRLIPDNLSAKPADLKPVMSQAR